MKTSSDIKSSRADSRYTIRREHNNKKPGKDGMLRDVTVGIELGVPDDR